MPFNNITIATAVVPYNGGSIELRGVSVADLIAAVRIHGPVLAMLFAKLQEREDLSLDEASFRKVVSDLTREAPEVVAAVIALAADEYTPENVAISSKLPASVQTQCLLAIFKMTFESESMLEKLVESVIEVMAGISRTLNQAQIPDSMRGIGAFDAA